MGCGWACAFCLSVDVWLGLNFRFQQRRVLRVRGEPRVAAPKAAESQNSPVLSFDGLPALSLSNGKELSPVRLDLLEML
jgi:hypothetical protein